MRKPQLREAYAWNVGFALAMLCPKKRIIYRYRILILFVMYLRSYRAYYKDLLRAQFIRIVRPFNCPHNIIIHSSAIYVQCVYVVL